jgi:hypothetical protein
MSSQHPLFAFLNNQPPSPRPPSPVEVAACRALEAMGHVGHLCNAANVASPAVAGAIFEDCQRALLESAEAFGEAARLAREMPESIADVAARHAKTNGGVR